MTAGSRLRGRAGLVAGLASLAWMPAARAATAAQVEAARAAALQHLDLQLALPHEAEPLRFHLNLPPELLWLLAVLGAAIILYLLSDMIPRGLFRRRGAWGDPGPGTSAARAHPGAAALDTADDLAHHGRYVEAMHVLLLQALADIRQRLGERFADSLTSREILQSDRPPERGPGQLQ